MTVKTDTESNVQQCVEPSTLFAPWAKLHLRRVSPGASAMFGIVIHIGFRASPGHLSYDRLTMDSRTNELTATRRGPERRSRLRQSRILRRHSSFFLLPPY